MRDKRGASTIIAHRSSAHRTSLFKCPRCGEGKLYRGVLDISDQCSVCGLPLKQHEQGDGPAFFAILLIGALATLGAAVVEIKYQPPFWVHAIIWIPFIVFGSLLCLRVLKAMLVKMQYQVRKQDF